ncbi:alpha,alpha-trehalase TreA [Azomonas macrocytogenes]|uniref:Putative periplasmic trehalase n=1 Tax=Azomonas macrocytogenes TaxID=69962 RepID=A0A839T237_AZOMA|nr:alpha,alpha-trehalase TreA [Azomonas macrocytogenes]MBB3103168.1 alpha,alpha-trehalase [Azomonas macrocytogenes]
MRRLPQPQRQKRFFALSFSILLAAACTSARYDWTYQDVSSRPVIPPDQAYPELFQSIQDQGVFDDQKQIVDAVPLQSPATIRADYLAQYQRKGFELKRFVADHFEIPPPAETHPTQSNASLRAHIDSLWPVLTRHYEQVPVYSSMLPLPYPYVVPGGRFRELYYWDSYFTMLGLAESGERQLIRQMLDNFAYLIDTYGHIPNGNRSYYLTRSQPPFFSLMVELAAQLEGDEAYRRYLPQLQKEYAYWMEGAQTLNNGTAIRHVVKLADGTLFNRYWDASDAPRQESWRHDRDTARQASNRPASEVYRDLRAGAESGWDFSSRWLGDRKTLATIRTTAIVPIDLNSLMYQLETTIALACQKNAMQSCTQTYSAHADRRKRAIERHLWNNGGYYADYDWKKGQLSNQITAATLYPLFTGVASPEHASLTAKTVQASLLKPGGLATTQIKNDQQWDAPNGWAPLQWIAVSGLRRYDQNQLAQTIGENFLGRINTLFKAKHKLVEKYDVEGSGEGGGGEYELQDGFGWTNGVTLKLLDLYPQKITTSH